MAVYVDNSSFNPSPGSRLTHHQKWVKYKTAVNKGVWEFRELHPAGPGTSCISVGPTQPVISRELAEFTPTNS